MGNFESSATFDAMNSDEIVAGALRKIKARTAKRLEGASAFKNPNPQPADKAVKAAIDSGDEKKIQAVIDANAKYWQEEAFNMGYKKALTETAGDLEKIGL